MGKSRKNKLKAGQRADPIAKPVKPPTDPELVALRDAKILPVLKDLQSTEPKSRITAARAIANVVQDSKCRKLLLREQIVHRVLTETLTDQSLESKAAGWFILKVLVQEEEADFCVHLYRQDVLTAIEYAAENVTSTIASGGTLLKLSKAEQQFVWDIAGCLVVLVAALAEASEEILKAMDNLAMVPNLLIALVSSPACPMDLLEDAMMSLLVLSEDNPTLADVIVNSESGLFSKLTELQTTNRLVSVPACGILHNLFTVLGWQDGNAGENGRSDATLVPTLSQALDTEANSSTDIMELALEILASIATDIQKTMEGTSKSSTKKPKKPKKPAEQWNGTEDVADEDEPMDEEGANDDSDAGSDAENGVDHEMDEDEMDADMEMVAGSDHDANGAAAEMDDLPTLQALFSDAVPRLIRLASAQPASDKDRRLQDHALAALNNLAWSVSCVDFTGGESAGLLRAWRPIARRIWDEVVAKTLATDTADVELATKVTGLAWALARTLRGTVLHGDPHRKFMALYQATKNLDTKMSPAGAEDGEHDPLQRLGVKCIGVLGLLAQDPAPISVNREIGVFLIRNISALPDTPVADAVEAIDQIFDMYADEDAECDKQVFWKDNFLPHLEEAVPKLRAAAKKIDKRTMFELRSRADETLLNLQRLIQYKHKHKPA